MISRDMVWDGGGGPSVTTSTTVYDYPSTTSTTTYKPTEEELAEAKMKKFDMYAKLLGWNKPYPEVPLWYQERDGRVLIKFSINKTYQNSDKVNITQEYVQGCMNYFSGNTVKSQNKHWAIPMLAADYYSHEHGFGDPKEEREHLDEELKYAKMTIDADSSIDETSFSQAIRPQLIDYIKSKQ